MSKQHENVTEDKSKRVTGRHFHVISGLAGGYMPNSNDLYLTEESAKGGLEWVKENLLEDDTLPEEEQTEKDRFTQGSIEEQIIYNEDGSYYAEINDCDQIECLEYALDNEEIEEIEIEEQYGAEFLKMLQSRIHEGVSSQ